jgi:integrase
MPITDFQKMYEVVRISFLSSPDISAKNKEYVKEFLDSCIARGLKPTRLAIIARQLKYLLERTPDIKKDMQDQKKINKIYAEIRNIKYKKGKTTRQLSPATYQTILNVSLVFVKWLNGGKIKPKGYADIKNVRGVLRALTAEDMINIKDLDKMASCTPDIQTKAILYTLGEGGFRPSEFIDLKIRNLKFNGKYTLAHIEDGKTGSRDVVLIDATPYIMAWLQQHPLKNDKNAPLWVSMRSNKLTSQTYSNLNQKLRELANKAKLGKPIFLYNFRHSAITQAKKLGVTDSMAMKNFGHKTHQMYERVYGRLFSEDIMKAFGKAKGEASAMEEAKPDLPKECLRCKTINMPLASRCIKCYSPLDLKGALDVQEEQEENMGEILKAYLEKVGLTTEMLTTKAKLMKLTKNEKHK